ncbi:MAG TPA: hypothetical protein VJZ31_03205 [Bacilli bacterium]|nr:hypothetical protein [Bacilli bacterium]
MNLVSRTRTHQLVYIAIMSGITIVLSFLTNFIPFMSIFLIVFLPFVAALVAITCDLKLFPIYIVASILLSVVIDASNFLSVIFYLLPALISGFVIGLTYRLKLNGLYMLIGVTFINLLANYAIIPVLDNLYQINFIEYSLGLIGLGNHINKSALFLLFLFILGLIQASFTYMIVSGEIYIIKGNISEGYDRTSLLVLVLTCVVSIALTFFHLGLALVFFAASIVLMIYQFVFLYSKSVHFFWLTLSLLVFMMPISFILAELNNLNYLSLYLIIPLLLVVIMMFLWEYIFSHRDKING